MKQYVKASLVALIGATSALAVTTPVIDIYFSTAEGFTESGGLEGNAGINAQPAWTSADVAGTGYAICSNSWTRARNYANFTLDVGHSVVIETTLRLTDADSVYSDKEAFRVGFAEQTLNAGQNIPAIGADIHTYANGGYWFGSSSASNHLEISSTDAGDWIQFTQYLTRGATSNEFVGLTFATNVTKGIYLGSHSEGWIKSASDGSWGGTMRPSFRALDNPAMTALEIDQWTVYTITDPPPSPDVITDPGSAPVTNTVHVAVDVTRKRAIGGFTGFNRDTWFGIYQDAGYGDWYDIDGMDPNEWVYQDGAMLPSRGTWDFEKYWNGSGNTYFSEDPLRPGFIDTNEVYTTYSAGRLLYAKNLAPHHRTIQSGAGHGRFAEYISWPTNLTSGVLTVSNHQSHAEATSAYFKKIHDVNALMPYWYEVMNESDVQNNFGWHWDADAWDKLSEFHKVVADRMAIDWPEVKVAGPCDAWAYRDGGDSSFNDWNKTDKKFIDLTGDSLGAYAFHAYEMDFTSAEQGNHATVYDAQFASPTVWSKGRLESFADLWQNEHEIRWGDRKPFIMSEYGILSWDSANYFTYLKSCNSMLVAMMDRPDIMDKMSVFILLITGWDKSNRNAMFVWNYDTSVWEKSTAYNYLYFWGDLNGDYLFNASDNYHVKSRAFLDGNQLYVVLHNNYNNPFLVNLDESLPAGTSISAAEIKKLYGNGSNLVYEAYAPLASTTNILLDTEGTSIVRLTLSNAPNLPIEYEDNYYGDKVLEDITSGVAESFTINIPSGVNDDVRNGVLYFSLHKANGFSENPTITVNGSSITNVPDITHSAGVVRCWKQFAVEVPADTLQEGANTVSLQFPSSGGKISSVRMAVIGDGKHFIAGTPLPGGTGMLVEVPTLPGREYTVYRSADLMLAGGWTSVSNFPGTGNIVTVTDTGAGDQQFYKVEMTTP